MRALGRVLRDAWRLSAPYFRSEERWSARLLLGAILGMSLLIVQLTVLLNYWNRAFFDSIQNKDGAGFMNLLLTYRSGEAGFMPGFVAIVAVYVPVAIYKTYLNQLLQMRWRRWMANRLAADYLSDRAYYTMSLQAGLSGADNPDQRIADDTKQFVEDTLSLGLDLLSNVVSLFSFAYILYGLSGTVTLLGVTIPGYLLWTAILYAILGSWLAQVIGRPLAGLEFRQQRFEADFRFSLARLRENTEGVALLGGEARERAGLVQRVAAIYANWILLIKRRKWVNTLIYCYLQVAGIFPIVVAAPRYFSGELTFGGLTQIAGAFGQVQDALSWFINSYERLAAWRATVSRLTGFQDAVHEAHASVARGPTALPAAGPDFALEDATLRLPDGAPLLEGASIAFQAGRSTVISGRSGAGKSTLFRALAGIWPFGAGAVRRPDASSLFLPQRPYIPLGTLRQAICYPADFDAYPDLVLRQALTDVGLPALAEQLDLDAPWAQRLSGGEQQRLAVARALLLRPEWLFMDEATSNLDPDAEAELYTLLRQRLPGTTLVSIAHRPAVAAFHDEAKVFRRTPGEAVSLRPAVQAAEP